MNCRSQAEKYHITEATSVFETVAVSQSVIRFKTARVTELYEKFQLFSCRASAGFMHCALTGIIFYNPGSYLVVE